MRHVRLPKLDLVAALFLGMVFLVGLVYTCYQITPSSYGIVLTQIGADEEGPIFGDARTIRSDEFAGTTAFFQICVRNGFRRINATSFYQEDLRSFYLLPIKDWSLIVKPELWAFFLTSPATAYSLYCALVMCAFLSGYFLLFRQLGIDSFVAAAITLTLYFSGAVQFWWTSFGSLEAGLPWILLILFAPLRPWLKALLFSWVMPVVAFSFVYPTYFAEFAFAGIILVAAFRPSLLRSPRDLAAVAIGGLVTGLAIYFYYHDLLQVMRETWYPGKRVGAPGTTPVPVALSQLYPWLAFHLRDYRNLAGINICEIGTVGSFLPVLALCLISPQALRGKPGLRNGLIVLSAGIALILIWQLTAAPRWIGHFLLWDHGNAERLLFISGLLIVFACVLVLRDKSLSPTPIEIAMFLVAGPVMSLVLKIAIFHMPLALGHFDLALTALGIGTGVIACLVPAAMRLPLLVAGVAAMNILAFGRFNPLQSAVPIFQLPETEVVRLLRETEAATPGHFLLAPRFYGATLNAMGFRSVSHTLLAPDLPLFRKYFPAMDPARFDYVFNRYAYISVTNDVIPELPAPYGINVPVEAFEPVRNARTVVLDVNSRKDCSIQRGGEIRQAKAEGNQLTVEGWAPWKGEEETQELHVISARLLKAGPLLTVKRPDVSEIMANYAYTRSGFKLQLSSADGHPIQPDEVILVAQGTSQGLAQIPGCGCPDGTAFKLSRNQ